VQAFFFVQIKRRVANKNEVTVPYYNFLVLENPCLLIV